MVNTSDDTASDCTDSYYNNGVNAELPAVDDSTCVVTNWPRSVRRKRSTSYNVLEKVDNIIGSQCKLLNDVSCERSSAFPPSSCNQIIGTINELRNLRSMFAPGKRDDVGDESRECKTSQGGFQTSLPRIKEKSLDEVDESSKTRISQKSLDQSKEVEVDDELRIRRRDIKVKVHNSEPNSDEDDDNPDNIDNGSDTETDSDWTINNTKRKLSDHTGVPSKNNRVIERDGSELRDYECRECKQIFTDFRALGGHTASHNRQLKSELDGPKNSYECLVCKELFNDFRALGGHTASHNRRKKAEQEAAGQSSSSMGAESSDDINVKQKSYKCNICPKEFTSGQALGGHKTYHRKLAERAVEVEVNVGSECQVTCSTKEDPVEVEVNVGSEFQVTCSTKDPVAADSVQVNVGSECQVTSSTKDLPVVADSGEVKGSSCQVTKIPALGIDLNSIPDSDEDL